MVPATHDDSLPEHPEPLDGVPGMPGALYAPPSARSQRHSGTYQRWLRRLGRITTTPTPRPLGTAQARRCPDRVRRRNGSAAPARLPVPHAACAAARRMRLLVSSKLEQVRRIRYRSLVVAAWPWAVANHGRHAQRLMLKGGGRSARRPVYDSGCRRADARQGILWGQVNAPVVANSRIARAAAPRAHSSNGSGRTTSSQAATAPNACDWKASRMCFSYMS